MKQSRQATLSWDRGSDKGGEGNIEEEIGEQGDWDKWEQAQRRKETATVRACNGLALNLHSN